MSRTAILSAKNISYQHQGKPIVKDVSLDIFPGEVVGLLGPNGAGKTSAFHVICGLLPCSGGQIMLDGQDISSHSLAKRSRAGLGFLAQERTLFPELSVQDNVLCALELKYRRRAEREQKCSEILEKLSLSKVKTQKARLLSGGEARRAELARILAIQPKVLLMDEPFAGVDPIAVTEIRELIKQLTQFNIGVLITDHNAREILTLCDRIAVIVAGNILTTGTKQEVLSHQMVNTHYLNNEFSDLLV